MQQESTWAANRRLATAAIWAAVQIYESSYVLFGALPEHAADALCFVRRFLDNERIRYIETPNKLTLRNGSSITFTALGEPVDDYEDCA